MGQPAAPNSLLHRVLLNPKISPSNQALVQVPLTDYTASCVPPE